MTPPDILPAVRPLDEREAGLHRELGARQISMIAIGSAIGTGLFLGSAVGVNLAGPGVILSYAAGALIALALMWAMAEMSVVHPVAGSFGTFAEIYLHPWAGFAIRYSYWLALAIALGSELIAAAIYCHYWYPGVPAWAWVVGFAAALVYLNARSVGNFGTLEYWFALIKVVTIFVFLIVGAALLFGVGFQRTGIRNYTDFGGFLPHGWAGVWLGISMAVFSYVGLEVVTVAAGEATHPGIAVPRAARLTLSGLALFHVGGMAVLVGVMPWTQAALTESPFVPVFQLTGIPFAAAIMNFVVLTAALSSLNANLYVTTRMLFSLARGGYAPRFLGQLNTRGVPLQALLASTIGMFLALILSVLYRNSAFIVLVGASLFGGIFGWIMIFVTHLAFRLHYRKRGETVPMRFAPRTAWTSVAGLAALLGVFVSTWWIPGMKLTILAGLPWLAFITLCYFLWAQQNRARLAELQAARSRE